MGAPMQPASSYAATASDNPYASPVKDSRYTQAPGRPLPSSSSNTQSRAGLILAFGICSLLLTRLRLWLIFCRGHLDHRFARKDSVREPAQARVGIDGRVRIGQCVAVVRDRVGTNQWLCFFRFESIESALHGISFRFTHVDCGWLLQIRRKPRRPSSAIAFSYSPRTTINGKPGRSRIRRLAFSRSLQELQITSPLSHC